MLFVAAALTLVYAAGALAQATPGGYEGEGSDVQQGVQGVQGTSDTLGSLPFTGLDLALIVGGGLLLVLAGLSLRRVANRRT